MANNPYPNHHVELFYEESPYVDSSILLAELQKRCGNVKKLDPKDKMLVYFFPDHMLEYSDGKMPPQVFLFTPKEVNNEQKLEESLQQSWHWTQARETLKGCRSTLTLIDLMAIKLDYKVRLSLFQKTLEAVIAIAPCKAIHWVTSRQFISPSDYLQAYNSDGINWLPYVVGIQSFAVANGAQDEMLIETLGMYMFNLPDIRCQFKNLDPNLITQVLYNIAASIYANGDVIGNNNTVQGINQSDKWVCRREQSITDPKRIVIDLDPGWPYAAGARK